jgi:uncharacterized membrane protein
MEFLSYLHPKLVHFPVAFFILYFLFEVSGIIFKKDYLNKAAYIILILGVLLAVAAVLTGNQAQELVKEKFPDAFKNVNSFIEQHQNFASFTLWYYFGLLILRTYLILKKKFSGNMRYLVVILAAGGCILIYMTALYGGDLVYLHGIGTNLFGIN